MLNDLCGEYLQPDQIYQDMEIFGTSTWFLITFCHYLLMSEKLCILMMLLSGQRGQTIHLQKLGDLYVQDNTVTLYFSSLLKHSKPNKHLEPLLLESYTVNKQLCIVKTIKDYISRTSLIRTDQEKFLISTVPPHKGVTKSTVARWIKSIMSKSGFIFRPHSCRAASTSSAVTKGLQIRLFNIT